MMRALVSVLGFILLLNSALVATDSLQIKLVQLGTVDAQIEYLDSMLLTAFYSSPKSMYKLSAAFDSLADITQSQATKTQASTFLGNTHFANEAYDLAQNAYLEALASAESLQQDTLILKIYNNIASCYRFSEQKEKALDYYNLAIEKALFLRDTTNLALLHNNIGIIYLELENYDLSESALTQAVQYYNALNNPIYEGITLLTRANMYVGKEKYNTAITDYQHAMSLVQESMVPILHAASKAGIGTAYNRMGNYKKGEIYLLQSLEKAKAIDHTEQIKESNRELSVLYEQTGRHKKALDNYKKFVAAKDSLFTAEQNKNLVNALSKYEANKKSKEIELLNVKQEVSALQLSAAKRKNIIYCVSLFALGLVSFLLFSLYRKIKSKNEIISVALSEKEILLREIHHRVKNNLQFISSLLGLQTEHVSDQVALGALQEGQDRVQSMALIHQNLYQEDNLKGVDMAEYFTRLVRGLFDSYNIRRDQISLDLDIDDLNLDVDTVIPIGLVVNELVSNSLKYAFPNKRKGQISVQLKEKNDTLIVGVHDDGIGLNNDQEQLMGTSFGYRLINVFKDQMKAELSINGSDGMHVEMKIQKYKKADL